ncbi:MAG: winged helix-turn-helix domain-containing protein [Pseudomonadota bacterium]
MKTTYDDAQLRRLSAERKSNLEVAAELGVHKDAARAAFNRRGLKFTPESARTVRDTAERMPPEDAVDYLLGVIEDSFDALNGGHHPIDDLGLQLGPSQRRLLVAMYENEGRVMTKGALYSAYVFGSSDDLPDQRIIDIQVCKLRQRIKGTPLKIETVWGTGYRLVMAATA